jgi:hypothetical protein
MEKNAELATYEVAEGSRLGKVLRISSAALTGSPPALVRVNETG